jgi:sigma-B regulation protein RsbU (phosphoserine phosphatase)
MTAALDRFANLPPKQLLEKVTDEVHAFVEDAEQSDDLTMFVFRYSPVVRDLTLDEELTLQNDVRQVRQLNEFVKQVMSQLGIEPSLAKKLRLAVEEAVVNVIDYAYPAGVTGDITVQASFDNQCLRFVIKDSGVAFDPTEKEKADTSLSAEDRPIGGLGILLVRELMDSINYERLDGMNVLTLKKTINIKQ